LLELLSLNADGEIIECFLASRENSVFLPKSDTLNYLREISADLDSAFKDSEIVYNYDPCSASNPCLNGGKCSSRVVVMKKTEIAESGDTIFNSPSFVQVIFHHQCLRLNIFIIADSCFLHVSLNITRHNIIIQTLTII
jgi:hypothetical protein